MSNALISFYHNLEEPIIIYDRKMDILYHNLSFSKVFGDFNNSKGFQCLSKLAYKFAYQMCFLKSEDLRTYCPAIAALEKDVNYTSFATYQKDEDKFFHFMIKRGKKLPVSIFFTFIYTSHEIFNNKFHRRMRRRI